MIFSVKLRVFCNNCQLFTDEPYLCERLGGSTAVNVQFDNNIPDWYLPSEELAVETLLCQNGLVR